MMEEFPCLAGNLTVSIGGAWSMILTAISITAVTGDFYPVFFGEFQDYSGSWPFQNNQLTLNSTVFASFN